MDRLDAKAKPAWSSPSATKVPLDRFIPNPRSICSGRPDPMLVRPRRDAESTVITGCAEAKSTPTDAARKVPCLTDWHLVGG